MAARLAFGFRAHSGWAAVVVVSGSFIKPTVLDRRRIVTADPGMPGSKQPFHAAEGLKFADAEALIRHCQKSSERLSEIAVESLLSQYPEACAAGILVGSGRQLPELAGILKSHALIHTAEGELYRQVLIRACQSRSLPLWTFKEREVWNRAAEVFGFDLANLHRRVTEIGKPLGPPWREDEKMASLAAWMSLATEA